MPKLKTKTKEPEWMQDEKNDSAVESILIEYPPASCVKCDTDMSLQGKRKWHWTGKKLIGPVCNECIKKL